MKIKVAFIMLTMVFLFQSLSAQNWDLVWSDEFEGSSLNSAYWTRETGGHGWGNNELQYYTSRDTNAFVQNGVLTIRALQENYGGKNYTSARLITKGKVFYQYGKVEARIKLPYGQGMWPAFWMMGENFGSVGWPACGEIDIMEMIGGTGDNTAYGAAHWDNNGSHAFYTGYTTLPSGVFADAFHTFTIEWNSSYIRWLMDGQQYHIIDITPQQLSEFHQDFFILLNVAVGGNWPGPPDGTTVFPQTMEVDYVRIYHDLNQMPSVSITSPEAGQDFTSGSSITITAEASDNDGTVEIVQFFQNSGLLGENDSEPYQITLSNIQPGNYSIQARVIDNDGLANFSDQVDFTVDGGNDQAPYLISPQNIPGIVEAENYDIGGEGVAYHDQDPENQGYFYRSGEGVDIEQLESGDGMNVGWIDDGEWLEYTLYVENSGEYLLETSVASQDGGGYYYIQMDEQTIVGYTAVTSTGGWQNWTTISHNVSLSEGIHVLRFTAFYGGFNFDKITTTVITGINDGNSILPNHFSLKQNYPNPFNPKTTITYQLPNKEVVLLEVYNSMGQKIAILVNKEQTAGDYSVHFNASSFNSGVYYYSLKTSKFKQTKKMVLIK